MTNPKKESGREKGNRKKANMVLCCWWIERGTWWIGLDNAVVMQYVHIDVRKKMEVKAKCDICNQPSATGEEIISLFIELLF